MEKILKEVEIDLKNGCYHSALAIALTLPDICIRTENKLFSSDYIEWVNNNISIDKKPVFLVLDEKDKVIGIGTGKEDYLDACEEYSRDGKVVLTQKIDGAVIYAIRCAVLHAGNVEIAIKKSTYPAIVHLGTSKKGIFKVITHCENGINFEIFADINKMIMLLVDATKKYYLANKEKFKSLLEIENFDTSDSVFLLDDE